MSNPMQDLYDVVLDRKRVYDSGEVNIEDQKSAQDS